MRTSSAPSCSRYSWRFVLSRRTSALPGAGSKFLALTLDVTERMSAFIRAQDDVPEAVDDPRLGERCAVDPIEDVLGRVEEVDPREPEALHVPEDRFVRVVDELAAELDRPAGKHARERTDAPAHPVRCRLVDGREDAGRAEPIRAREAREPSADDRDAGDAAIPAARLR